MGEEMAIETIAAEYAKLKGYLCEMRVPFKTTNKGHSDFDVLAYHRKRNEVLLIECKAWGKSDDYLNFSTKSRTEKLKGNLKTILKHWSDFKKSKTNKWGFKTLDKILFIIPGYSADKGKEEFRKSCLPGNTTKIKIEIMPIHELLLTVIEAVKDDKDIRRKRYSNPAAEFCRWLVRCYDKAPNFDDDLKKALQGKPRKS